MDPQLQQAIENDDVDALHRLIVRERNILDRVSEDPFPNTPLHVAAAAGKTQVAMEMAILKPSFARKLNPEGYSPMHLALQHEHHHTVRALITLEPELIRVRGRCGITLLHYVAEKEGDMELELLAEFLVACNSSINDLTSRCETALHVAVKNHNLQAFEILFGWLKRVHQTYILDWKDQHGNTVFHIAASERQLEIFKQLIGHMQLNMKNLQNKTALGIFHDLGGNQDLGGDQDLAKMLRSLEYRERRSPPTLSLSQFFRTKLTTFEKCKLFLGTRDKSTGDIILIVSTLIATAAYQATLTPPGGYWQDDSTNPPANTSSIAIAKPHRAGNMIMNGFSLYMFTILNSMVFWAAMWTILATAITLLPDPCLVSISVYCFGIAYALPLLTEFPKSQQVGGMLVMGFYLSFMVAVLFLPFFVKGAYIKVVRRIDTPRWHPGNFLETKNQK